MYYVNCHKFGRVIIKNGPMSGCLSLPGHEWKWFHRCRSKTEAIEVCKNHPHHSTVNKGMTSEVVFDNGKEPGKRE